MKKLLVFAFSTLLLSSCLKEEALTPNPSAAPPVQEIPTTGGNSNVGGPEFFNYTLDGDSIKLTNPNFVGSSSFGQITSKLAQNDFFQIVVTLSNRTFPDTNQLSSFSTNIVYNETLSKRYNGEAGLLIFTSDTLGKITGTFDIIMKNEGNPSDSIVVTKGSFSVNK